MLPYGKAVDTGIDREKRRASAPHTKSERSVALLALTLAATPRGHPAPGSPNPGRGEHRQHEPYLFSTTRYQPRRGRSAEVVLEGDAGGGAARGDARLAVDGVWARLDGVGAEVEPLGDPRVGEPLGQPAGWAVGGLARRSAARRRQPAPAGPTPSPAPRRSPRPGTAPAPPPTPRRGCRGRAAPGAPPPAARRGRDSPRSA